MEAQAASSNGDSTANGGGGAPQPQRERKPPRARGERNGQAKTFYKGDGEQSDGASDGGEKQSQDKKVQKTQGNRSEKVYLPKGSGGSSNGGVEANGGDSHEERPKTRTQKGKEGGKKKVEKKRDENEVARIVANERFDNSSFVDSSDASKDPHRALQISEATRLQEIVPSGVSKEVQEKVKRIQEVIGDLEFHVVYGALEDLGYDEEKTVSFFLDKKPAMVKKEPAKERRSREKEDARRSAPQTNQRWTSIVKKGLKTQYGVYDENGSQEPEVEEYQQQPQQQPRHRTARVVASQPQEASQPSYAQRLAVTAPNGQSMDSETLVTSLTMAIASQLKMIHEQTRMLTAMQNELANITQAGSSEKEQLLNEQEMLRQREAQLLEELEDVRNRMEETDRLLAENQKKKVERLSSITQNNYVAQILRSQAPQGFQAPPQSAPAAHSGDQHRPPQQHPQQQHPQQQHPQQRERTDRHQRDRWERTEKPRNQNRKNQDKYT